MPKFVLIEPSLCNLGGHFFEYAVQILQAAEDAGFEPVLACNERFQHAELQQQHELPSNWLILPALRFKSDRIHRISRTYASVSDRSSFASKLYRLLDSSVDRFKTGVSPLRWYRRSSRIAGYAAACAAIFRQVQLETGDQVFCSTMSDLDLLGLVRFLESDEASRLAHWHLQFHFAVYAGREPEYRRQERAARPLKRRMAAALERARDHQISIYTTTDHLTRQYQRLSISEVSTLPWPVSPRMQRSDNSVGDDRPLRLVCAGAVRREKGVDQLPSLIDSLWDEFLNPGQVQLLLQANDSWRTRAMLGLNAASVAASPSVSQLPAEPVVSVPHPLSPEDYATYLRRANIGLAMYDACEYYVRCSGVLVEMLSAGVPVIVPSGCWMGDQVDQINQSYLLNLFSTATSAGQSPPELVLWNQPWPSVVWSTKSVDAITVTGEAATGEISLANHRPGGDLLISFEVLRPRDYGHYISLTVDQYDDAGRSLESTQRVIGHPRHNRADSNWPYEHATVSNSTRCSLIPIDQHAHQLKLSIANAYHTTPMTLGSVQVRILSPPETGGHRPVGHIGVTAAGPRQIPQLLRNMLSNYNSYRLAARHFAEHWSHAHAPARSIERLCKKPKDSTTHPHRQAG